mgnify:CR=1 FL=1
MPIWAVIALLAAAGGGGYWHLTQMEKDKAAMQAKVDAAEADAAFGRKKAAEADMAAQREYMARTGKPAEPAEGKLIRVLQGKTKTTTVPVESKEGLLKGKGKQEEELVRVDDARPDLTALGWGPTAKASGVIRVGTI